MESTREQILSTAAYGICPAADKKSGLVVLKRGMVWTRAFGKQRGSSASELMVSFGLWEYQGADPNMRRRKVIKQGRDDDGMGWKSRFLKALATTGSDHFVKLYKANYYMGGSGTSRKSDSIPFDRDGNWYDTRLEVNRLYL